MAVTETQRLDYQPPLTSRPAPRWVVPLVVVAALLGLAGIGVGAYALATQPAKVSGPPGSQGAQGPQGQQGPQGVQGKPGPAGTVASTSVVRGTTKTSAPNPAPGTVLDETTSCPAGKILVSGGAQVSAPGVAADRNVTLRSSFPVNDTSWESVALVTGSLGQGVSMTMTPYVVCGVPANSSSTSSTPSSTP